jgi:hypothetical protein
MLAAFAGELRRCFANRKANKNATLDKTAKKTDGETSDGGVTDRAARDRAVTDAETRV